MVPVEVQIRLDGSTVARSVEAAVRAALSPFGNRVSVRSFSLEPPLPLPSKPGGLRLRARRGRRVALVDPLEIRWARSEDDYLEVDLGGTCHHLRLSMSRLEAMLPATGWVRVHRCHLVRLDLVTGWRTDPNGALTLSMPGTRETIPVSRSRRAGIRRLLEGRGIDRSPR